MDKDHAARFVTTLLSELRSEIAETTSRAERLGDAVKHNAETRETATALLEKVRGQRAERERRRMEADAMPPTEH
jgi:hypothetical protein